MRGRVADRTRWHTGPRQGAVARPAIGALAFTPFLGGFEIVVDGPDQRRHRFAGNDHRWLHHAGDTIGQQQHHPFALAAQGCPQSALYPPEDITRKWALYARLAIQEYYLNDPLTEYLRPPLQGERLDMRLRLVSGLLRFSDWESDQPFLSPDECAEREAARANAEAARAQAEATARREAERRIAELEPLLKDRDARR